MTARGALAQPRSKSAVSVAENSARELLAVRELQEGQRRTGAYLLATLCSITAVIAIANPLDGFGSIYHWFAVPCLIAGFSLGFSAAMSAATIALVWGVAFDHVGLSAEVIAGIVETLAVTALAKRLPAVLAASAFWLTVWPVTILLGPISISYAGWGGIIAVSAAALWATTASRFASLYPKRRPPYTLRITLLSTILGISVWISSLLLCALYISTTTSVRAADQAALSQAANLAQLTLDEFVDEHRRGLSTAADLIATPWGSQDTWLLLNAIRTQFPGFISLLIADDSGKLKAASFSGDRQRDSVLRDSAQSVADREYFKQAMQHDAVFVSGGFRGRGFGSDALVAISLRTTQPDGEVLVIEGSISLDNLRKRLVGAVDSGTGVLLVDGASRILASNDTNFPTLTPVDLGSLPADSQSRPIAGTQWLLILMDDQGYLEAASSASHVSLAGLMLAIMLVIGIVVRKSERLASHLSSVENGIARVFGGLGDYVPNLRLAKDAPAEFHRLIDSVNEHRRTHGETARTRRKDRSTDEPGVSGMENKPEFSAWATFTVDVSDPALRLMLKTQLEHLGLQSTVDLTPDLAFADATGRAASAVVHTVFVGPAIGEENGMTLPAIPSDILDTIAREVFSNHTTGLDQEIVAELESLRPDAHEFLSGVGRHALDELRGLVDSEPGAIGPEQLHRLKGTFASLGASALALALESAEEFMQDSAVITAEYVGRVRVAAWLFAANLDRLNSPSLEIVDGP